MAEEEQMDTCEKSSGVSVEIIGMNLSVVFFKFESSPGIYEQGWTAAGRLFVDGVRAKSAAVKGVLKLRDYVYAHFMGKPCRASIGPICLPLADKAKETFEKVPMDPKWFAYCLWTGEVMPSGEFVDGSRIINRRYCASGNPDNLEVEVRPNVRGIMFRTKKLNKSEIGFIKFLYNGEDTMARMLLRDFFDGTAFGKNVPDNPGNLPVVMDVCRLKHPGRWPEVSPVDSLDTEALHQTEFVARVAWAADKNRPQPEDMEAHANKFPNIFRPYYQKAVNEVLMEEVLDMTEDHKQVKSALFPMPKDATELNRVAKVVSIHNRHLFRLELPDKSQVLASKRRLIASGRPVEDLAWVLHVGDEVKCDLAKADLELSKGEYDWLATIAWIDDLKPDIDEFQWQYERRRNHERAKILFLDQDFISGCKGGLLYCFESGQRAIFHRNDTYLFDTCVGKADLTYFFGEGDKLTVITESITDPDQQQQVKQKYKDLEVTLKATAAWVGEPPTYRKPEDDHLKFTVQKSMSLCQFLTKRKIQLQDFIDLHVTGNMAPKGHVDRPKYTLVPETVKGKVIDLKRPDCNNPTNMGLIKVTQGSLVGQLAFFNRHAVYIYGHNMSKSNLMDVILTQDVFNLELASVDNNNTVPYNVLSAWLGSRPVDSNSGAEPGSDPDFEQWLRLHKLTWEQFKQCKSGFAPPNPYFPLESAQFKARVHQLIKSDKGATCGALAVTQRLIKNQTVVFDEGSVFLHGVHFVKGDLNYVFKEGDKVCCELVEFSSGKERKRCLTSVPAMASVHPPPKYYANIVYVGSRPKPGCLNRVLSEMEIKQNMNLTCWLSKRNVTTGFFSSMLAGEAPPKPFVLGSLVKPPSTSVAPVVQPPPVLQPDAWNEFEMHKQDVVRRTRMQADAMMQRVLACYSPEDPKVKDIISGPDDLQLALFMSKSLAKAIMCFQDKNKDEYRPEPIGPPNRNNIRRLLQQPVQRPQVDPQAGPGPFGFREPFERPKFGPEEGRFGKQGNQGANQGNLGPNQGNLGPNQGNLGPNKGNLGPNQGNLGPNQGNLGPKIPQEPPKPLLPPELQNFQQVQRERLREHHRPRQQPEMFRPQFNNEEEEDLFERKSTRRNDTNQQYRPPPFKRKFQQW